MYERTNRDRSLTALKAVEAYVADTRGHFEAEEAEEVEA